jgi:hypothetical protein
VLRIREIQDCLLQGFWFVFHALIVRRNRVLVNYIVALIRALIDLTPPLR